MLIYILLLLLQSDLVCYGELRCVDLETGAVTYVVGSFVGNLMVFTTERLTTNRLYNVCLSMPPTPMVQLYPTLISVSKFH